MGQLGAIGNDVLFGLIVGSVLLALKMYEWKRIEPRRSPMCRFNTDASEAISSRLNNHVSAIRTAQVEQHLKLLEAFNHLVETVKDHESEEIRTLASLTIEMQAQTSVLRELLLEVRANGSGRPR